MTARVRRDADLRHTVVLGGGKVGAAFARALRAARVRVTVLGARDFAARPRMPRSDLIIIASRDPQVAPVAAALAGLARRLPPVVHCAGALDIDVLEPLRARGVAAGTMHPMLAFADAQRPPALEGASLVISGDADAVACATRLARRIGMTPVVVRSIDRAGYHAAASLVANGAAALAALGADVLVGAGIEPADAGRLLGPLLASVGSNVLKLGPARALSGPVRRGDARTVQRHLDALRGDTAQLYFALVRAQLPLARALGEATASELGELARLLERRAALPDE